MDVTALQNHISVLEDRLEESVQAQAQLMAEDRGWAKLTSDATGVMNGSQRHATSLTCRAASVINPLLKRGLAVRAGYIWGQGVGITLKDDALNAVVQDFLDDDETRMQLTGHQAHVDLENRMGVDGNYFCALFTDPYTGRVRPRLIDFHEVEDKITDPEDKATTWFYVRSYTRRRDPMDPASGEETVKVYHPDLRYRPVVRPRFADGDRKVMIRWDAPIIHVHDNGAPGEGWGIPDVWAGLPWARLYSEFMTDWAKLAKAIARIAFVASGDSRTAAQRMRTAMAHAQHQGEAGGTIVTTGDMQLKGNPASGVQMSAESGRPIASLVAAALGIPVTQLTADPGATGARAVAETLDKPTMLEMQGRRHLHQEFFRAVINHVIDSAALAPGNPHGLRGTLVRDGNQLLVQVQQDRAIDFEWPSLTDETMTDTVRAVVEAWSTGLLPAKTGMLRLLRALGVRDPDAVVAQYVDADGNLNVPDADLVAAHGLTPGGDYAGAG